MTDEIRVGMADMKIGKGGDKLVTFGLGSCVAILLYDETNKVGGLAHIMLPDSKQNKGRSLNPAKFADTAVNGLIEKLIENGARRKNLKAKIAGGAEMFNLSKSDFKATIGSRNIQAVKRNLRQRSINITGQDVGGNQGRTVELFTDTSKVTVRTIGNYPHEI